VDLAAESREARSSGIQGEAPNAMSLTTRAARTEDIAALVALAKAAHAGGSPTALPLLGDAVARGLVRVAEVDGEVAGYVAVEKPLPNHVRIASVAVRHERRRQGIGTMLIGEVLQEAGKIEAVGGTVATVIDVTDLEVAGLLLSCGFIATRVMRSSTPEQAMQLYYQHKIKVEYVDPDARHLVPLSRPDQLVESLSPSDHAVTALATLSSEPAFEISRFEQDDPASLQSGEAAAGIAFSGSILAAITFLLGFSFVSSRYPDDVRLLLIGATFATTMSLIIYASASGELARIRSNSFGRVMKWGNVLSEYGGVLPFLVSLPITYAQGAGVRWSAVVVGVVSSTALVLYERSQFSIAHRFRWTRTTVALTAFTSMAPTVCVVMLAAGITSWPLTAALAMALTGRTLVYLYRRGPEAGVSEFRRTWQIRR
jgi:N-acetylglutamate synthase-like GNAT family acetyltransferase